MIRRPAWFSALLATLGTQARNGEITDDRATRLLARAVLADAPLLAVLAHDFAGRELGRWHCRRGGADAQPALFPALPGALDVAPGTFRSQASMTRHDWQMHLRIAEARRDNAIAGAEAHFADVLAVYNTVMPLLASATMTTAEALRHRPPAA
jgi:hypothetical protein